MEDRFNDKIVVNEVQNVGCQVHLYYDPTKQEYQAYGYSAYIITHTVSAPFPTYATNMQMPMVAVDEGIIDKLKKKLEEIIYLEDEYYLLEAKQKLDEDDYDLWSAKVRG